MRYYILYLVLTTLLAHSILVALFDGHIFAGVRGILNRFRDKAEDDKSKIRYIFGYLLTCYMCMSYWVSWAAATALFFLLAPFMQNTFNDPYYSCGLIVVAGFISAGALNILNLWLPPVPAEEDDVFFPWSQKVEVIDIVATVHEVHVHEDTEEAVSEEKEDK